MARGDADQEALAKPTVLDLFCGAGGLAEGFAQAGYKVLGGIDNSIHAIRTFEANFSNAQGVLADLRSPDLDDLERQFKGVDVVVGGPSCQGFSTSGGLSKGSGRDEADPRNRLFINYIEIVERLQPSWIVFENVPGLLLYESGKVALDIVEAFAEIGYKLVPMILLAADYGVPQLRRRLVFVGNRTKQDISFPAATHGDPDLWKGYALPFAHLSRIGHGRSDAALPHVTFDEACADLPIVAEGGEIDRAPYQIPPLSDYQQRMRIGSELVCQHASADLSALDRVAAQTLEPGQNWRNLSMDVLPPRFAKIRSYDATTILKRLRGDQPAYTITTKFNEATTGAFLHPTQARTLTLREAARLQSFPDRFLFSGSAAQIRQQIGNAVPPLLARAVAEAIYPDVMFGKTGVVAGPVRDVVVVDNAVGKADILKLHGARKRGKPLAALETVAD
jgi:DNA (cytosine-5)-methyltransferase 1